MKLRAQSGAFCCINVMSAPQIGRNKFRVQRLRFKRMPENSFGFSLIVLFYRKENVKKNNFKKDHGI